MGAHHPRQAKAQAIGRGVLQGKHRLRARRCDASAVDSDAVVLANKAEFHRVPIHPGQQFQRTQALGAQAADALGLDVVGEHGVHQHRHMAEKIVEHIGLFQIVKLIGCANEVAGRKAPLCKVGEKDIVGHQARDRDDPPSCVLGQNLV